jgi:lysophospholipid acyltransferase (LPLAT)-like uncharacterized protein
LHKKVMDESHERVITSTIEEGQDERPSPSLDSDNKQDRVFTLWDRAKIWAISVFGYLAVLFIGRSLRWEVYGRENYEAARRLGKSFIVTFWHCQIFPAIWYWRKRGMAVMVSQNFDGEYTTNVVHWHGNAPVRGSSSRRASRVVVEMIRALREGREGAITPDGPRGPRFVAKPGVVQLAKYSGAAILCFHITPQRSWVLRKSWDQSEIPKPFSRTAIFIAPPILVAAEADENEQTRKLAEVQATLDDLVRRGEAWRSEGQVNGQRSKIRTDSLPTHPNGAIRPAP